MTPLPASDAEAIWAVLVAHAGVSDDPLDRGAFIEVQSSQECREWRFVGCLGWGGKFRRNRVWVGPDLCESWTVDCYAEDLTPARAAVIEATNQALAELQRART